MANFREVSPNILIKKLAEELKKADTIKQPSWATYAKTGCQAERAPSQPDWWHLRSAALLRKIAVQGPIGTEKLRTVYGRRKRRGHKPAEFRRSGGSAIRKVLQQLEKAGFVKQKDKGIKKGRIATPKGISLLDCVAKTIK
ncbi:30S ribosomal protein S19e [Candidatus Woesearchaeota archaeon CG10_big_fil_rev_8_21_14_0_10_34_8]|nr:MAG: 30S ribosomal protein S19e [Candidatus Woesearchaeota archaeon CG10_big_fil_rev_8_21_14_0_10_34_8]